MTASGLASIETLNVFIDGTKKLGIYAIVDMIGVENRLAKPRSLKELREVVLLHGGIDIEKRGETEHWHQIQVIKNTLKERKLLIAVAGGVAHETARDAINSSADIIIVGRFIAQSKNVERSVREFLECALK